MINWKGIRIKRPWPNSRYNPGICWEDLRKATKNLSQNSQRSVWNLNRTLSEYKYRAPPLFQPVGFKSKNGSGIFLN
jgi:hypothetical protein